MNNGLHELIKPLETTNIIVNPSFEVDLTGHTNTFTGTQSAAQQFRGVYSLKLVATGADTDITRSAETVATNTSYVFSGWLYVDSDWDGGNDSIDVTLTGIANETKTLWTSGTDDTAAWRRIYTTFDSTSGTAATFTWQASATATAGKTIYIDALQLEAQAVATTYVDGEQDGGEWLAGTPHVSAKSKRLFYSKAGGTVVNLRGDKDYAVSQQQGFGKSNVSNVSIPYAILGGSQYRRTTSNDSIIDLPATVYGTTLNGYHVDKKGVIELLDADATQPQQKTILRYTGVKNYVQIPVLYDSGLETSMIRGFSEQAVPLRLVRDPFWNELAQQGAELAAVDTVNIALVGRRSAVTGLWDNTNTTTSANGVHAIIEDIDRTIIAGGDGIIATGIQSPARYDGAWVDIPVSGTGAVGGSVLALAIAPDGTLYAGGSFTTINGVAAAGIAQYDGATWSVMGTGTAGGDVYAIAVDDDGNVYAGGDFTGMGGIANTDSIAKWTGSVWVSISSAFTGVLIEALEHVAGTLWVGGQFSSTDATTINNFAKYDISSDAWSTPASVEPDNRVACLAIAPDNSVYLGGTFTTIGTDTINRIARFDGSNYQRLGEGADQLLVSSATVNGAGELFIAGTFTSVGGGLVAADVAKYSANEWQALDLGINGVSNRVYSSPRTDDLYLGLFSSAGVSTTAGAVTSINNRATSPCYPIITLDNSAASATADSVVKIESLTTRQSIYFTNLTIQPNEIITIDLRQGIKSFTSNTRGDMLRFVRRGGQENVFKLLAGNNDIAVFVNDSSTLMTARMYWDVLHSAADGGASE